ncbi:MAG: efflux RND transporter periplasmic adaptor subunit, partial [Myxococcota bacterium]
MLAILFVGAGLGFVLGRRSSVPMKPPVEEDTTEFTCSMHPEIRASEPGACPICGMPLVPVEAPEENVAVVRLGEGARARARIRTALAKVEPRPRREMRLLGRIAVAEDRLETVTSWVAGRVDRLSVAATGAPVHRGQTVARLYAPELFAAERALQVSARKGAPAATVAAARRRLELLG